MSYRLSGRWSKFRWFEAGPYTNNEFFDQMSWERELGGTHSDDTLYLPDTDGGTPVETVITASRTAPYGLEVRTSTGTLVNTFTNWFNGSLRLEVDRAAQISFSVKADAAIVADLVRPNRIWLRDRWGLIMETFNISRVADVREGDTTNYTVEGLGTISQLGREPVISYSTGYTGTTPDTKTIGEIIQDLLGTQVQTPAIKIGTIRHFVRDYAVSFYAESTSVLDCLIQLQQALPKDQAGHFFVDGRGALNWYQSIGTTGETLSVGGAVQDYERADDHEDQINRVYMYGEGEDPATRLKLTDAGEANEYVEDATSVAAYGVQPYIKIDKRIRIPSTLLAAANRIVEEFKNPVEEVSLKVIELSQADTPNYGTSNYNDIYIGSRYTLADSTRSISTVVFVKSISYDLSRPLSLRIGLSNRRVSLADILRSIVSQIAPPLDVNDDGTRYPNIARVYAFDYSQPEGHAYRAMDLRRNAAGRPQWYDGTSWQEFNKWEEWTA